MRTWYNAAKTLAFGELRLKPWELDRLSVFEFNDMVDACNEIRMAKRWETAYWEARVKQYWDCFWLGSALAIILKPAKAGTLMRPFLKQKTKEEQARERERFYADFERQRKEAGNGK